MESTKLHNQHFFIADRVHQLALHVHRLQYVKNASPPSFISTPLAYRDVPQRTTPLLIRHPTSLNANPAFQHAYNAPPVPLTAQDVSKVFCYIKTLVEPVAPTTGTVSTVNVFSVKPIVLFVKIRPQPVCSVKTVTTCFKAVALSIALSLDSQKTSVLEDVNPAQVHVIFAGNSSLSASNVGQACFCLMEHASPTVPSTKGISVMLQLNHVKFVRILVKNAQR